MQGGATGAINDGNTASTFNGTTSGFASTTTKITAPNLFSEQAWFKTTSTAGGKIVGFGDVSTGSSTNTDRHIYLDAAGHLNFGVYNGAQYVITSPNRYNDGQYHQVVATLSAAGLALYADGVLVGTNTGTTLGRITSGYWRVGGDTSWSGAAYFNGTIDDVSVYGTALSPAQIRQQYLDSGRTLGSTPPPTAAITTTVAGSTVSVNGSGSSASVGTIASYSWQFGDGTTATGVTASHTYLAGGTFTITLTVTDSGGLTGSATAPVTVAVANQPPVASFTSTVTNLSVAFNASASSDPDGSITAYAWSFGDGGTGTGATPNHNYTTSGTYPATLQVTDNSGATAAVTHSVTVAPATSTSAADTFTRTVGSGWGAADTGGVWTVSPGNQFSVDGSSGKVNLATAGASGSAFLQALSATNVNIATDVSVNSAPSGNGTSVILVARHVGTSDYRLKLRLLPGGVVHLTRSKVVAGTETVFSEVLVTGLTYNVGDVLRVRFQVTGTGPGVSTLSGKVWNVTTTEPATAQISGTDTDTTLQSAGSIGLVSALAGNVTTAPTVFTYDNFSVVTS